MKLLKILLLIVIALPVFVISAPIVFIIRSFYEAEKSSLPNYWLTTLLGLDQFAGSILYGTLNWTISGYSYYLMLKGSRFGKVMVSVIDAIFGKGHCKESYDWDLKYDAFYEINH